MTLKSGHSGDLATSLMLRAFLYFLFFSVSIYLFYQQVFFPKEYWSDIPTHLSFVRCIVNGDYRVMHLGFHFMVLGLSKLPLMNYEYGALGVLALMSMLTLYSIEKILSFFLKGRFSRVTILLFSMAILYVSPIYFPLINSAPYLGVWSPNPWHNPTFLAARPFTLIAFFLFPYLLRMENIKTRFYLFILGGLLIAFGAFIKPSFILAFIPAGVLFAFARRKFHWITGVKLFVLFAPVFLLLATQYFWMYGSAENSKVGFGFLKVWKIYAQSVPAAIIQAAAFPLVLVLFRPKSLLRSDYLFLGWLLYLVALAEFCFCYEAGVRMADANFSWGYMSAIGVLFICSVIEFLQWIGEADLSRKLVKIEILVLLSLFSLHLFSGLFYFSKIISRGHI